MRRNRARWDDVIIIVITFKVKTEFKLGLVNFGNRKQILCFILARFCCIETVDTRESLSERQLGTFRPWVLFDWKADVCHQCIIKLVFKCINRNHIFQFGRSAGEILACTPCAWDILQASIHPPVNALILLFVIILVRR